MPPMLDQLRAAGYEPAVAVCGMVPGIFQKLEQAEIDTLFLRLLQVESGTYKNRLLEEVPPPTLENQNAPALAPAAADSAPQLKEAHLSGELDTLDDTDALAADQWQPGENDIEDIFAELDAEVAVIGDLEGATDVLPEVGSVTAERRIRRPGLTSSCSRSRRKSLQNKLMQIFGEDILPRISTWRWAQEPPRQRPISIRCSMNCTRCRAMAMIFAAWRWRNLSESQAEVAAELAEETEETTAVCSRH